MVSFTYPINWECFNRLCDLYPRNVGKSKIFRITVEEALKQKQKKSNQSIVDFADKYSFNLDSDVKLWKNSIKEMDAVELRELQKLLKKREGLIGDELYKRTR